MPWTIFLVPNAKRTELDAALHDDIVSRQSQTVRDAASAGGPAGEIYVVVEGSADAVARADTLLAPLGKKLPAPDAEAVHRRFAEEQESASAGMGLFFTEE